METEELKLKIEKLVSLQILSADLVNDNLALDVTLNQMFAQDNYLIREVYRLATYEELMAKYPADWKQAFKERWFPDWLLKWFPVKYREVIAKHKFPEFPITKLGHEFVDTFVRSPDFFKE